MPDSLGRVKGFAKKQAFTCRLLHIEGQRQTAGRSEQVCKMRQEDDRTENLTGEFLGH